MPAEPMTLLLRPRNFFTRNPCLDIPPSFCSVPSGVRQGSTLVDRLSRMAFGEEKPVAVPAGGAACCSDQKFGAGV
jgi:primary-amine oxidase